MNEASTVAAQRKRAIRRNLWLLAIVAAAFYVGFIVMSVRAVQP